MLTCAPRPNAQTAGLEHLCLPNDDDDDDDEDGSEEACELSIRVRLHSHRENGEMCRRKH